MSAAPTTTQFIVPGPAGDLEVLVDEPPSAEVSAVALVCHPHPLFGGNMSNKVTHILARTFNDAGAPAVRFNFRGVGKSAGTHDDGNGEVDDALSMIRWLRARWPNTSLWLSGFSFGAAMALRAANRTRVSRLVTVAPALRWLQSENETPGCPWLIVQGDQDELVNAAAVQSWAQTRAHSPDIKLLSGVDHFFHGRLNDLRDAVTAWLAGQHDPPL